MSSAISLYEMLMLPIDTRDAAVGHDIRQENTRTPRPVPLPGRLRVCENAQVGTVVATGQGAASGVDAEASLRIHSALMCDQRFWRGFYSNRCGSSAEVSASCCCSIANSATAVLPCNTTQWRTVFLLLRSGGADSATEAAVLAIQRRSDAADCGEIHEHTWAAMSRSSAWSKPTGKAQA